ncbi:MAG: efflux RND transporter periplasmic adaptor subunit [Rubrivivax sp.]
MNTNRSRTVCASVAVAAIALLLSACGRPAPAPQPGRAGRARTNSAATTGGQSEFAAEVRARTETRLGFRVPGKLMARPAEVGQRVRSGQVLARIDATDLRLSQDAAQAGLRSATSSFEQQGAEFKRFTELREQGFISAWELERRKNALEAARAQLDQARAQADVQGNQAAYAVLTANADGIVTAVEAEPGTVLSAGTPVLRLAHDGPRDAVFQVSEDAALGMRVLIGKRQAITVRPWGTTQQFPATVREVAAAADPVTRTFTVKADLGDARLQLGQTLTALVSRPVQAGVARLPLAALWQQQGQSAVWVLDPATMTVKAQTVVVAGADGNEIIVAQGLSAGQQVVTAGVHVLTPGLKVKRYLEPGSSASPGGPPGSSSGTAPVAPVAASQVRS